MAGTATDTTSIVAELSDAGFKAFYDGICSMFNVDVRCEHQHVGIEPVSVLQSRFKQLAVVHVITAHGALNGTFHVMFDQGGLFVLSGVVVMLPENRILEQVRQGSIQDAQNLQDVAGEVGNLLVGAWDSVFRERCTGHKHLVKKASVVGESAGIRDDMGLSADEQVLCVTYQVTVGSYPSFQCAAVFPSAILGSHGKTDAPQADERATRKEPVSQSSPSVVRPLDPVAAPAMKRDDDIAEPSISLDRDDAMAELVRTICGDDEADEPPGMSLDTPRVSPAPRSSEGLAELLQTQAADIMETDVVWARAEDTVQGVLAKMQQKNTGYVLIGQNGILEGLVSSSTILGAVSLYLRPMFGKWRRPEDDATLGVRVKWIMSRPVRTIRPDTSLEAMIECMRRYGGRCLPVVDEDGSVKGMVTVFDILLHILTLNGDFSWQGRPPQAPALLL